MVDDPNARALGREVQAQLFPPGAATAGVLRAPDEIALDWARLTRDVAFGSVWARPGLAIRDRSMITVAMLTALHMPEELRVHIGGALNVGVTRQEISEVIMHAAIYGGWPVAVEGMHIAAEVFASAGEPSASTT